MRTIVNLDSVQVLEISQKYYKHVRYQLKYFFLKQCNKPDRSICFVVLEVRITLARYIIMPEVLMITSCSTVAVAITHTFYATTPKYTKSLWRY